MALPLTTAQFCFCDKFRPTWFPSDGYSASSCPYNVCPECRELQAVDTEIIAVHNLLTDLSKRRHDIKSRINRRHDHLTSKLPLEVISYIFNLVVVNESYVRRSRYYLRNDNRKLLDPVVRLGAVCKQWREITLGTPQLWTTLTLTEHNLEQAFYPSVISQRLHRSHALPLFLQFDVVCSPNKFPDLPYSTVVPLLRSQAHRWNYLSVRGRTPATILNVLLMGLEERVTLDSLALQMSDASQDELDEIKITMKYPFSPKRLVIDFVSLPQIPIQWDRLTHLTTDYISVDDLVHIFRHAHNLRYCCLDYVQWDAGHYTLPDFPVTNVSMKQLEIGDRWEAEPLFYLLLVHLTLPSLEILNYRVESSHHYARREIEQLSNFLDHSQAPLHDFSFKFDMDTQFDGDWYSALPSITTLDLRVREHNIHHGQRMQDTLERLGAHVEPIALPRLREMKIHGEEMNAHSWQALAAIFPDYANNKDVDTASVARRPLNDVRIHLRMTFDFNQEIMPEAIYSRLRAIQKSGVTLQVFDGAGYDILGPEVSLTLFDRRQIRNEMVTSRIGSTLWNL